jgi:hypothetical protein
MDQYNLGNWVLFWIVFTRLVLRKRTRWLEEMIVVVIAVVEEGEGTMRFFS